MMGRILVVVVVMLGIMSGPVLASGEPRIAVLEIQGQLPPGQLAVMSDKVRSGVLHAMQGRDYVVMSRENMAMLAKDMGLDLSCVEGACEVETGRNIGAAYVVTGTIQDMGGLLLGTLKVFNTDSGALLATGEVRGDNVMALVDALPAAVVQMMARALPGQAVATPPPTAGSQEQGTTVQVGPVTETGQAEAHTGASADFAALAAMAQQAKANREHKEKALAEEQARLEAERARLAEEERRTKAALRAAQQERLDKEISKLKAQASADFAAIEDLVTMPVTSETRPVLQAYLKKWGDAKVTVDDLERKVSVPELAAVRRAMSNSSARPAARSSARPAARSRGAVVTSAVLSIVGGSMLAWSASDRSRIKNNLQAGTLSLSSAKSDASTVNTVVIVGYSALGVGAAVWVGTGLRQTATGPTLSLGGRW